MRRNWNSCTLLERSSTGAAPLEGSWAVPQKLNTELPCDPVILLVQVYPKELKTDSDTYTPVFTAALFTVTKGRSNPDAYQLLNG